MLGKDLVYRIQNLLNFSDDFSDLYDLFGEQDFQATVAEGNTVFRKINQFDHDLTNNSPDPSDLR